MNPSKTIFRLIISANLLVAGNPILDRPLQDTTPTPTLAPEKSDDLIGEVSDPQSTSDQQIILAQPTVETEHEAFTQADLSVLTGNVQRPNGLFWHGDNIYAACSGDWTIYEIDDTSGRTITYAGGIRNGHTLYSETNENGQLDLWVPDFETGTLFHVDPARRPVAVTTGLDGPWGIAHMSEQNFLITNLFANNIIQVSRNGETVEVLSGLRSPVGIVTDSEYVYFANNGSARRAIEWFEKSEIANGSGDEAIVAQPLVSGLQNTTGLAYGGDNYLYFAYSLGTRGVVGRVDPDHCREVGGCGNHEIEIVVYTELAAPLAGLTLSPDMRLFVHTLFDPSIYWVQLDT